MKANYALIYALAVVYAADGQEFGGTYAKKTWQIHIVDISIAHMGVKQSDVDHYTTQIQEYTNGITERKYNLKVNLTVHNVLTTPQPSTLADIAASTPKPDVLFSGGAGGIVGDGMILEMKDNPVDFPVVFSNSQFSQEKTVMATILKDPNIFAVGFSRSKGFLFLWGWLKDLGLESFILNLGFAKLPYETMVVLYSDIEESFQTYWTNDPKYYKYVNILPSEDPEFDKRLKAIQDWGMPDVLQNTFVPDCEQWVEFIHTNQIDIARMVLNEPGLQPSVYQFIHYNMQYIDVAPPDCPPHGIFDSSGLEKELFPATDEMTSAAALAKWNTDNIDSKLSLPYSLYRDVAIRFNVIFYIVAAIKLREKMDLSNFPDYKLADAMTDLGYKSSTLGLMGIHERVGWNNDFASMITYQILPDGKKSDGTFSTTKLGFIQPQQIATSFQVFLIPPFKDRHCFPACPPCFDGVCEDYSNYMKYSLIGLIAMVCFVAPLLFKCGYKQFENLSEHLYWFSRKSYAVVEMLGGYYAIMSFAAMRPASRDFADFQETVISAVAYVDIVGGGYECLTVVPFIADLTENIDVVFQLIQLFANLIAVVVYTQFMAESTLPLNSAGAFTLDYILAGMEIFFFLSGKYMRSALQTVQSMTESSQIQGTQVAANM